MSETREIVPGEFYRHFKNKLYQIKGIAFDSETKEKVVVYQALYGDFLLYVRPYKMFASEVDRAKYPDVTQKFRFERVILNSESSKEQPDDLNIENETSLFNLENHNLSLQNDKSSYNNTDGSAKQNSTSDEVPDERLIMFLDAESYQEKLNILAALKSKMDNRLINNMAASMDIEVPEGSIEDRFNSLRSCVLTHAKYECNRLR